MINIWKASAVALTLALGTVASGGSVPQASADVEAQPHMRRALVLLEEAKAELARASADKGGHRAKAIEHTQNAIEETKKGIAYDNRH